jgi:hypothetical protein
MPGDFNYAHEKFATAVRILALNRGELRDRVLDAYRSSAASAWPPQEGLGDPVPDDVLQQIATLHERMTVIEGPEGSIAASIAAMSNDEVRQAAEEILAIFHELDWEWHEQRLR